MTDKKPKSTSIGDPRLPMWVKMITAGFAGSIAEIATIPLDTAKVRLQIQGASLKPGQVPQYNGLLDCVQKMGASEGIPSLYKGLTAGLHRQMVFCSLKIGLYEPVKNTITPENQLANPSFFYKVAAALATGTIGISIANPTDVVKIRLQAEGKLPAGSVRRYNGTMDAYPKIIAAEGIKGLWTGVVPNIFRNSIINAAELASYDQIRSMFLLNNLMDDHVGLHLTCSGLAGFIATVVGSPVDVLKTRIMNAKPGQYTGIADCVVQTVKNEGFLSFYNGFQANAGRIVSWNMCMFVSLQQIRNRVSDYYFPAGSQN